jgi:hypothetical protein
MAISVRPECRDDVDVANLREFKALLGESPDLIPEGSTWLLSVTLKIPGVVGHMYVPWKLSVKKSLRSSQLSIVLLSKWLSQALAVLAR